MTTIDRPDGGGPRDGSEGRCASCSTPLDADARFCHACGTPAAERPDDDDLETPGIEDDVEGDAGEDEELVDAGGPGVDTGEVDAGDVDADVGDDAVSSETVAGEAVGGELIGEASLTAARDVTGELARVRDDTAAVAVLPATPEGSTLCRACSAENASDRLICGACGVDLDTGETGLAVEPVPVEMTIPASSGRRSTRHRSRWGMLVLVIVAALAVVGGVVGALAVLGVGPFASGEQVPDVEFVPGRYTDEPQTLVLTDVATLTMRPPEGELTFTPERMVDGDPFTSWHQDASALPENTTEKVDLFLEEPAWVTAIVLANGDHLEPEAYAAAARIQQVELIFDGNERVAATLLDQGLEPQIVELSEPALTTTLRIEIISSIPGQDSDDVALSRVELFGHVADGTDVDLAARRAEIRPAAGAVRLPSS